MNHKGKCKRKGKTMGIGGNKNSREWWWEGEYRTEMKEQEEKREKPSSSIAHLDWRKLESVNYF